MHHKTFLVYISFFVSTGGTVDITVHEVRSEREAGVSMN
jgi:hypothetical protein